MFGPMFDGILAAILGVLTVILLMGKGEKILELFNGNRLQKKKRTEEEKKQYSRVMGVFTGILALSEVLLALFPESSLVVFLSLGLVLMDLVLVGIYSKKYK